MLGGGEKQVDKQKSAKAIADMIQTRPPDWSSGVVQTIAMPDSFRNFLNRLLEKDPTKRCVWWRQTGLKMT